jgi:AcrR family transcriptional regulator
VNRRDRMRDATLQEIKEVARDHLRARGPAGISLRGIARVIGMTAPALYRYFSGLDDLLAAMIETYTNEICDAMEAARDELPEDDIGGRLVTVTRTFRQWALEHRPEFTMVFGSPVPGYTRPEDGTGIDEAGSRLGAIFFDLMAELWQRQPFPVPADEDVAPELRHQLEAFADNCGIDRARVPLGVIRVYASAWIRLYGMVAMEIFGQIEFMIEDAEPLFEAELAELARTLGLKKDQVR